MSETVVATGPSRTRWFAVGALAVAAAALRDHHGGRHRARTSSTTGAPPELHAAGAKAVGATIRLGGQVAEGSVQLW